MGCTGNSGSSKEEVNFFKDESYALGLNIGTGLLEDMAASDIYPNINELLKGLSDGLKGKKPRFDLDEARNKIEIALESVSERRNAEAAQEEIAFLAENSRKPGIIITSSGLQYEILTERTGPKPTEEDSVLVHYDGKLADGKYFDSSYTRGKPDVFELSWIIPGWSEGIQLMSVGSKYRFYVPSELGYGDEGRRGWDGAYVIPPFATLIFEIELLEINPKTED